MGGGPSGEGSQHWPGKWMRAAGPEFRPETPKHSAGVGSAWVSPLGWCRILVPPRAGRHQRMAEEAGLTCGSRGGPGGKRGSWGSGRPALAWPSGQARMSRAIPGWPGSSSTCSLLRLVSHLSPGAAAICMYFSPKGRENDVINLLSPELNAQTFNKLPTNYFWN